MNTKATKGNMHGLKRRVIYANNRIIHSDPLLDNRCYSTFKKPLKGENDSKIKNE